MKRSSTLGALFAIAALASGATWLAQDHPKDHPKEHPKAKDTGKVSMEELTTAITGYVKKDTSLKGGYFLVYDKDAKKPLALTLDKVHQDKLARVAEGGYFACADFKTADGKDVYDLDIFMKGPNAKALEVTEVSVHKENGKERYTWEEKSGAWTKKPVAGK